MRYITGFLDNVPMLKSLVANRTKETIELINGVVIEVHSWSFRAVRGYTLVGRCGQPGNQDPERTPTRDGDDSRRHA